VVNDFWLEALNINSYKNGHKVLKGLSLKLNYSDNVILIGPNGSGKSSLIELINRNIYPVLTNNMEFKLFNNELINLWELRKKISTVNTEIKNRINPKLRVLDVVASGLYGKYSYTANKNEKDYSTIRKLFEKLCIKNLSEKYFSHLSDGEKQIALIARALIKNPEIIILDEPVANLDYKSKFLVIDHLKEISKLNTKILCVTHDISIITEIFDRILMLKEGLIIADGSPNEVMNSANVNKLFDINVEVLREENTWKMRRISKQ